MKVCQKMKRFQPILRETELILKISCNSRLPKSEDTSGLKQKFSEATCNKTQNWQNILG
jgi:hypothetical protein